MRTLFGLALLVLVPVSAFAEEEPTPLRFEHRDLLETEAAFARVGVREGQRAAWLGFFASDGVMFVPEPVNALAAMEAAPAQPLPLRSRFDWEPIAGSISADGTVGYNVGPWAIWDVTGEGRPPRFGYFFSVWKREDGDWKVAADLGAGVGAPTAHHRLGQNTLRPVRYSAPAPADARLAGADARELDARLAAAAADALPLDPDPLLVRDGLGVVFGRADVDAAMRQELAELACPLAFDALGGGVAGSGDLAWSYGRYRCAGDTTPPLGHYLHVWRHDAPTGWGLAASVRQPLPPPADGG